MYELWKGRKPNVKYFHMFGSTCYILADREYHRKRDAKSDTRIFLGYSYNSRANRVFNNKMRIVMETINVVVNDNEKSLYKRTDDEDDLSIQPFVTPELTVADVSFAHTIVTNYRNSSKST